MLEGYAGEKRRSLIVVWDVYQLRCVPENDEHPARAFDSPKWPNIRKKFSPRCSAASATYWRRSFLFCEQVNPQKTFRKIVRGHKAPERGNRHACTMQVSTVEEVAAILEETPHTLFVIISKKATKQLNDLALQAKFSNVEPLCLVPDDPDGNPDNFRGQEIISWNPPEIPMFYGMTLILTQNLHKDHDYGSGMRTHMCGVTKHDVRVQTITGRDLVLYRLTDTCRVTYFPIRLGSVN